MAARGSLMKTRNFYAGNIKMALLYDLYRATAPSPDRYKVIEKGYSFKVSTLSAPDGTLRNY